MTTIMTVGNSEGSRRCDATCHDATEKKCVCICGGRYHGKGSEKVTGMLQEDLEEGVWGESLKAIATELRQGGQDMTDYGTVEITEAESKAPAEEKTS